MSSRTGMTPLLVRSIDRETSTIASIQLESPHGHPLPRWKPGAHIDVQLITRQERQYSLCGDPSDAYRYRIAVRKEDRSRGGSHYIHSFLKVGSTVWVRPPRNHFELKQASRYLLLAAGIGLTPILPMAKALADARAEWRMVYLARSLEDAAFTDEIAALGPQAEVHVSRAQGRLDLSALLKGAELDEVVYACGPAAFVDDLISVATDLGMGARLHVERFTPKQRAEGPSRPFTVMCARSEISVPVDAGQSMLKALQENGIPASGSCLRGVCGSCALSVLDGEPDHRDSLTSANEHGVVYPCVSRSFSPVLVVDV